MVDYVVANEMLLIFLIHLTLPKLGVCSFKETVLPGTEGLSLHFRLHTGYLKATPKKFLHFWSVDDFSTFKLLEI